MLRKIEFISYIILTSVTIQSCAFFNTFYHARKAYNNGIDVISKNSERIQPALNITDVPLNRFAVEPEVIPAEAKTFFDVAIEKSNKVVVLYPKSGWAEDATLLLGKAHYLRAYTNDWYDAKNRLEVFLTRYPESKKAAEAKLWYGRTLLKMGQIDEAEDQFRQIAEDADNSKIKAEALLELGDIEAENNNFTEAGGYYVKATLDADGRELKKAALYKSFYAYFQTHDFKKAIGYLNILIQMDLDYPERFDAAFMKARALKLAGEYKESIRILDGLIGNLHYKNYFLKAEFEIADILRLSGRNRDAVKQFEYVIETYNNPVFTGDAYYFLGLIYDRPVVSTADAFAADPELAKKYFYLVKTRYTNATYYPAASERFDYLTKMDFFRNSIRADETLLKVIENKINDTDFVVNIENYFPSTSDTMTQTVEGTDEKSTAKNTGIKPAIDTKKEIDGVKISNTELDEKIQNIQLELLEIAVQNDPDTLHIWRYKALELLAGDYILLADYFYFNLSNYDSAGKYYQYVIDHFKDTPYLEFALYGYARVQEKKQNPESRSYYQYAYNVFPEGRLSDIGRKVLGLKEQKYDSLDYCFTLAEENILHKENYEEAIRLYTQVALTDSAEYRLKALYALGILYEKKLDNKSKAFRLYNTLVLMEPNSVYAKKVKSKVDAYVLENRITLDSLKFWVDRDFIKIQLDQTFRDTVKTLDTPETLHMDSTQSRLPQEVRPDENEFSPLDSVGIRKRKDLEKIPLNELESNRQKKGKDKKGKDAVKLEEVFKDE